ncbi:hypothetical protein [Immundisolibacter cernigliae]|uniref:hypothetical protein n=1 Tax=Immundisolibacter cernigliae TaxID=1810504 RepID=UPI0011AB6946|nr:hypothetical protein [Immundisolibacter cernigliae]
MIYLVAFAGCSGPQTDAEMRSLYESKKEYFTALVSGIDCNVKKSGILWRSEKEQSSTACLDILEKARIDGIGIDPISQGIMLFPSGRGYSSHQKGYVYSEKELEPQFTSLDVRPNELQPYQRGFKKIDENWYITYEYVN